MTVYELIQRLTEFEPLEEVKVCVVGKKSEFDEYKKCYDDNEPKIDVGAVPIYVEYPYFNGDFVEIICKLCELEEL